MLPKPRLLSPLTPAPAEDESVGEIREKISSIVARLDQPEGPNEAAANALTDELVAFGASSFAALPEILELLARARLPWAISRMITDELFNAHPEQAVEAITIVLTQRKASQTIQLQATRGILALGNNHAPALEPAVEDALLMLLVCPFQRPSRVAIEALSASRRIAISDLAVRAVIGKLKSHDRRRAIRQAAEEILKKA